jgi:hypothetical protein
VTGIGEFCAPTDNRRLGRTEEDRPRNHDVAASERRGPCAYSRPTARTRADHDPGPYRLARTRPRNLQQHPRSGKVRASATGRECRSSSPFS